MRELRSSSPAGVPALGLRRVFSATCLVIPSLLFSPALQAQTTQYWWRIAASSGNISLCDGLGFHASPEAACAEMPMCTYVSSACVGRAAQWKGTLLDNGRVCQAAPQQINPPPSGLNECPDLGLAAVDCPLGAVPNPAGLCQPLLPPTPTAPPKELGACGGSGAPAPVGNPCSVATGNKYQREQDYRAAAGGLSFERHYNSLVAAGGTPASGPLGWRWRHGYERSVAATASGARVTRADGKQLEFVLTAGGAYEPDADINLALTRQADAAGATLGWRLTDAAGAVEQYDAAGRLVALTPRGGLATTLSWDLPADAGGDGVASTLDRVSDPYGRTLRFSHDSSGRITAMTDPAGGVYGYAYDPPGNLSQVSYPDDTAAAGDNPKRTYVYEDGRFAHHLTGIVDENGARYASWAYDDQGRAVLSEHAGGAERGTLAYHPDGSTTYTGPLGQTTTYRFQTLLGVSRLTALEGDDCPACGPRAQALDARGNVISRTDWNGVLTRYQYDSRNLEISRTEAAGTPQERTVTTQWHPVWRLPAQVNEPGRITRSDYDPQGRLISRTVTDTASGTARTTTYQYTAAGQLAAVDGPRSDVADTLTHAYDTQGNRVQSTNALGQTSRVTQYNAHGQPTEQVDANGVITRLSYDARQRLIGRIEAVGLPAEARTQYAYDAVGQLSAITPPDGSVITYTYDAARRLTGITDSLGNRVDYTLNAQGQRTREQTYDPGGVLRRNLERVYDSQGRLQQLIGAGG